MSIDNKDKVSSRSSCRKGLKVNPFLTQISFAINPLLAIPSQLTLFRKQTLTLLPSLWRQLSSGMPEEEKTSKRNSLPLYKHARSLVQLFLLTSTAQYVLLFARHIFVRRALKKHSLYLTVLWWNHLSPKSYHVLKKWLPNAFLWRVKKMASR
jgi:hypothetical protein